MFAAEEASISASNAATATKNDSSTLISDPATSSPTTLTTSSPASSSTHKLSGGAIAGLAIGVVAFLFILATAAFLLWRRRGTTSPFSLGRATSRWRKSELEDTFRVLVELHAEKEIKKMPINERPAELPGSPLPPAHDMVLDDEVADSQAIVRAPVEVPQTVHTGS